jgi:hypothetical protein
VYCPRKKNQSETSTNQSDVSMIQWSIFKPCVRFRFLVLKKINMFNKHFERRYSENAMGKLCFIMYFTTVFRHSHADVRLISWCFRLIFFSWTVHSQLSIFFITWSVISLIMVLVNWLVYTGTFNFTTVFRHSVNTHIHGLVYYLSTVQTSPSDILFCSKLMWLIPITTCHTYYPL